MNGLPVRERLKALRRRSEWTVRAFAEAMGYGEKQSSYRTYEDTYKKPYLPLPFVERAIPLLVGRGDPPITKEEVYSLAGITPSLADDVASADMSIARFPAPQGYVAVPTLEPRAGMGGGGIVDGKYLGPLRFFEESFVRNELRAAPEDLCVVEVEGQSMEPLLRHGDTVLVDRRKVNLGMEGIFVLYDGEYVVCKWAERVHGSEPPMVRIRSSNLDFSPYEIEAERCQILGRVVWFARRL